MLEKDILLPKYPESAELGAKGVRMVADVIEDQFHWIFRPNEKTDVGIDGEIEYVDENRKSKGKLLAVQIKCGQSFFSEKTNEGYIFRCREETVNYWLGLSLPVILCLCNHISNEIFWCHITVGTVKKLKKGYKILVPLENKLDKEHLYSLKNLLNTMVSIQSIADAAIYKHLYERYKTRVSICPIVEEPRDFHALSYIADIKDELCIIGSVINKYGYFQTDELEEIIRLYYENRVSCGWEASGTKSYFMLFFVSECAEALKLTSEITMILDKYKNDIRYERLLLNKQYIDAALVNEKGEMAITYDENGSGEYESYGNKAWK